MEEPLYTLAPIYGISDVALKKICNKLRVPTPPVGYWAKKQHGYKVDRIPLPKLKEGEPDSYTIHYYSFSSRKRSTFNAEAEKLIQDENKGGTSVKVRDKLRSPHPLVRETARILQSSKPDRYGVLRPVRKRYIDIRVAPENLNRALRIMDALIKALEKRGFPVSTVTGLYFPNTRVKILGEKIKFSLHEWTRQIDHVLTDEEIRDQE